MFLNISQMEMMTSGMDHSLQYIPQLATHLSSLHVSNANPYMTAGGHGHGHGHGHHAAAAVAAGYPTLYAPNQSAAVMPTLSLATGESDPTATASASSPDEPFSYGKTPTLPACLPPVLNGLNDLPMKSENVFQLEDCNVVWLDQMTFQ